jgi:hypothetical protein
MGTTPEGPWGDGGGFDLALRQARGDTADFPYRPADQRRLSRVIVSRRKRLNQASVRSITRRCRPKRSELSMPCRAIRGWIACRRSAERLNDRNGDRERGIETRLGTLSPGIPKRRQGSYFPPFLEPRKTAEKALVSVIREAWSGRVSTRRAGKPVQAMDRNGISKSQVSKLYHRRRARAGVVGIFPNETGIARLIGAVLLEQNDMYGPPRIARMITLR